jgi:hypothetical protein
VPGDCESTAIEKLSGSVNHSGGESGLIFLGEASTDHLTALAEGGRLFAWQDW